jgi:hypothetical protein
MKRRLSLIFVLFALLLCSCARLLVTDAAMCGFVFSHSGMHTGLIYTLSAEKNDDGWRAELSLLCGEREYSLPMAEEEVRELAALVEAHRLAAWNGFDKADPNALDGTGFELRIRYEDGQEVRASGSNAFPEGYKAAHEAVLNFFGSLMKKNGIENPL